MYVLYNSIINWHAIQLRLLRPSILSEAVYYEIQQVIDEAKKQYADWRVNNTRYRSAREAPNVHIFLKKQIIWYLPFQCFA